MASFEEYDDVPCMQRLRHKKRLIYDLNCILTNLASKETLYKRYYKKFLKSILKDGLEGFKKINKKNPVFIEMPSLKPTKIDGYVKEVYDNAETTDDENILINIPDNPLIEDKQ